MSTRRTHARPPRIRGLEAFLLPRYSKAPRHLHSMPARAKRTNRSSAQTLWTALSRFLRYRREYRHLEALPDHLLRDLDLTRSDIHRAIRADRPF